MKTLLSYLLLTVLSVTVVLGQTIEEKEREIFRKHKVKSRAKWDYNFKGDIPSLEGKITANTFYDKEGRILRSYSFNLKGDTINYDHYKYDANGNRILYERKSLYTEYKKESEYNRVNNLIEEAGYDGGASFQTLFVYDDKNRVKEISYLIADEIDEKRVYTYTGTKSVVKILKLGKHLVSTMELLFDNSGKLLEEKSLSLDGKVIEKKVYKYNSDNNIIEEEKYKGDILFYRVTYNYDSNKDLLSLSEEATNKPKFIKKKYTYDDKGRIVGYEWKRRPDDEYNKKVFIYNSDGVCSEEHTFYPRSNYKLLTKYEYEYF